MHIPCLALVRSEALPIFWVNRLLELPMLTNGTKSLSTTFYKGIGAEKQRSKTMKMTPSFHEAIFTSYIVYPSIMKKRQIHNIKVSYSSCCSSSCSVASSLTRRMNTSSRLSCSKCQLSMPLSVACLPIIIMIRAISSSANDKTYDNDRAVSADSSARPLVISSTNLKYISQMKEQSFTPW